jgi:importin subunit alpha-6/7
VCSNVGAGSQYQIQALLDSGCLATIFELCLDPSVDVGVRTEACWIVLNATSCGSERQIETLVRAGAVRVLCSLIKDSSLVMMALEGLEKILQVRRSWLSWIIHRMKDALS